jgi:hypothetical protein
MRIRPSHVKINRSAWHFVTTAYHPFEFDLAFSLVSVASQAVDFDEMTNTMWNTLASVSTHVKVRIYQVAARFRFRRCVRCLHFFDLVSVSFRSLSHDICASFRCDLWFQMQMSRIDLKSIASALFSTMLVDTLCRRTKHCHSMWSNVLITERTLKTHHLGRLRHGR